jgi:hypothetical protein
LGVKREGDTMIFLSSFSVLIVFPKAAASDQLSQEGPGVSTVSTGLKD